MPEALSYHPLANLFPLLEGAEFADLVEDVRQHGVREPIMLLDGLILDGRNRWRAARAAGVECPATDYGGDDPLAFVVSLNLKRRHLDESQRAWVAAQIAKLPRGANQHAQICAPSQAEAAELLNVSRRSVQHAATVRDYGVPELGEQVAKGKLAVWTAAEIAKLSPAEQKHALRQGTAVKRYLNENARAEKLARIESISAGNTALPLGRSYPVLLADPPWRYTSLPLGDERRHTEFHYPTLSLDEICALPVADIAAGDSVLFLWATVPLLPEALDVIRAWGFRYSTGMAWVKPGIGMGFHVRGQFEHLLIARRGNLPVPVLGTQPGNVIEAPRREHSRKPDEAYDIIEAMYPGVGRIELFARGPARAGWAAWGNEAACNG